MKRTPVQLLNMGAEPSRLGVGSDGGPVSWVMDEVRLGPQTYGKASSHEQTFGQS